jgi:predicted RNA-binding protein with PIN domain
MVILVDAYNLLNQVFTKVKHQGERRRNQLIQQLGYYQKKRLGKIKEIIVVFDAGPLGHATREVKGGITVIFSGQRSCADEWIIEYVRKNKDKEILVVTLDRKLIEACRQKNVSSMKVHDFYDIVKEEILENVVYELTNNELSGQTNKFDKNEYCKIEEFVDNKAMDILMDEYCMQIPRKDECKNDSFTGKNIRSGNPRKLSKKEKKRDSKVKKLKS